MADSDGPKEVGARLELLRIACDYVTQEAFAKYIGTEKTTYNNWVGRNPKPVPRDMAIAMVRKISGLSLDWIYFGREDGVSKGLLSKLRAAERLTKVG